MKRLLGLTMVTLLVAGLTACGSTSSSGGGGGSTPTISTVDALPRATSPVVTSGISSINVKGVSPVVSPKATTGINMGDFSQTTFSACQSMAACQAANHLREVLNEAAQADKILCYVQTIVANDTTGQLATIYDGNYHIFGLSITGEEEGHTPDHIKMKITKTGDYVTGFEMFACVSGEQAEYLSQTISGSDMSMTGKGFYTSGEATGGHQVEVTGTLNSSGYFTAKSIEIDGYNTSGDNTNWTEAAVTQYSDKLVYDGYDRGTWGGNEYINRVYSQGQMIDPNTSESNSSYDIGLIALGDGAVNGVFSSGEEWESPLAAEGWNGDTLETDNAVVIPGTETTWVSQVENTTPAASADQPTIAFATDQQYTCDGTEEVQVTGNQTEMDTACAKFDLGHNWVDCYTAIQPDQCQ